MCVFVGRNKKVDESVTHRELNDAVGSLCYTHILSCSTLFCDKRLWPGVCGKRWDNVNTAASKRSLHHTKYLAKLLWALRMASWLPRHSPMSCGWVVVMR